MYSHAPRLTFVGACCLVLSVLLFLPAVRADIHNVSPGESIQAAIDAAVNGDEVVLAEGTYHERINFNGQTITVRSTYPSNATVVANTVIDADHGGPGVTFSDYERPNSVLAGLTITNGGGAGGLGGIYCCDASPTITGNIITGSTEGGVYCLRSAPAITGNTISGNTAASGGGIYVDGSTGEPEPTIACNIISGNTADYGGGIYVYSGLVTIAGNVINGNTAADRGGGVYSLYGAVTISGNTISGNTADDYGGGIGINVGLPAVMSGNTVSGNASDCGGGVSAGGGDVVIRDCIIAFSPRGGGIACSTTNARYCDVFGNNGGDYVQGAAAGTGCISADPLFFDAAGGDFHLQSTAGRWNGSSWVNDLLNSPCIDAGDPASPYANEPAPNGHRANMGAYGNTAQASRSALIAAIVAETDTAYASVQAAMDAAAAGWTVVVQPGTWHERIDFNGYAITVRSADPSDPAVVAATILDGQQLGPVVSFHSGESAAAKLQGLTIRNGSNSDGGGIRCANGSSPTITDNVVTACTATVGGGGIWCGWGSNPTIGSNRIYGNSAGGGGGIGCWDTCSPTIVNNVISGNTGWVEGGGIDCNNNCAPLIQSNTIVGNTAPDGGGIIAANSSAPRITNCIIASATAGGGISGSGNLITYCDVFGNLGGEYVGGAGAGAGCISADPLFAAGAGGDFHLQSTAGRWNGASWVTDLLLSPCLDAGDPTSPFANEPAPNGGRVNMGFDGNTAYASKTGDRPPSQPTALTITPSNPLAGDDLIATAEGSGDPDGDPFTYQYQWRKMPSGGSWEPWGNEGPVLPHNLTTRGDQWMARARAINVPTAASLRRTIAGARTRARTTPRAGSAWLESAPVTVGNTAIGPDLLIRNSSESSYTGDGIYNTDGAGQAKSQTVAYLHEANYCFRVYNDGGVPDTFTLSEEAAGDGFKVRYFINGQGEKTADITGAGYTTSSLAPGTSVGGWAEVTPRALSGTQHSFLLTARSNTNDAMRDAVSGSTTRWQGPDLCIRTPDEWGYTGDNIYNTNGASQTKTKTVVMGTKTTYLFRVYNDKASADSFRLKGPVGSSNVTVRYLVSGHGDQTDAFTGAGYTTPSLDPGASVGCWVEVTLNTVATTGKNLLITATSVADGTQSDAVKATTYRQMGPDMQIRTSLEASYTGDNIYNADGAGQTKTRSVAEGVKATYLFRLYNDENVPRSFRLTGPSAGAGWAVRYCVTGQGEKTGDFTGAGYLVSDLASGGVVAGWVDVTPLAGGGATQEVLITGTSTSDATRVDAVKATTTRDSSGAILSALAASPTRGGAQIIFSLSASASVRARILNLAGRTIRTLCEARPCAAGTNTLLWNAQSDAGLRVPNGTYVVEVVSHGAEGASSRAIQMVTVGR